MKRTHIVAVVGVALAVAAGFGAYHVGMDAGMRMAAPPESAPAPGRKILYWHDPMYPEQRFDKPGKSPFMDMQLVPVYGDTGEANDEAVRISPSLQQSLGMRTAEVTRTTLAPAVEAVGNVAYNERDLAVVQARANGFLEKLHVRATLDPVRKGQALAELYVPDWVAAQEEYLSAKRIASQARVAGLESLVEGARQRMRLAGMSEPQIAAIEKDGKVHARLTIAAPIAGVVSELSAREGMTVAAGTPLFRINGLATVWINAEVPEAYAAQLRPGAAVQARAAAFPGATFKGRVSAILPQVDAATRTLKARVEVQNPEGKLVPGMFATVVLQPAAREVLVVPSEAVIATGKRTVVVLAEADGRFTPVDVEVGAEANGRTEIRKGMHEGQKVVASGQFLVDSEASLKATTSRMQAPASQAEPAGHAAHPEPAEAAGHAGHAK
jgi:Cu(I)/Ag(I) efflux system membrane fusion protein